MRERVEREGLGKGKAGEGINPRGYLHWLDQEATSFFFSNFPEEVTELELWQRFAWFGRVGDVYIPKKVDKQGCRFGFVKFRGVKDALELLRSISNIWIGSFKLRVNRSKFRKNQHPSVDAPMPTVLRKDSKLIQSDMTFNGALVDAGRREGGLMTSIEDPRPRQ
jgi:RNA recognition motif-containing protein